MPINQSDLRFFEILLKENTDKSNTQPTITDIREAAKKFAIYAGIPEDIFFEDITIQVNHDHSIRLRFYHQDNTKKPIIIYFQGNAFIHDLFNENHAIISKIAKQAHCHAVMVDCRLAPEHTYPAQLQDALAAIQYIAQHIDRFYGNKERIILAGFSSGANLAAVATNQLRNSDELNIFYQLLISGAYDYTNSLHEFDEFALQDKMLDPNAAQFSFDCYSQENQRKEPTCSPYWEADLSGLPPTTIMVTEYDGGRSQSEGYARKLINAGNKVEKIVLPGQTHGTILYRKACFDGEDPAVVAGEKIYSVLYDTAKK